MDTGMTMYEETPKGNVSKKHWLSMDRGGIYLFILILGLFLPILSDYLGDLFSDRYLGISYFARDWLIFLRSSGCGLLLCPVASALLSAFLLRKCSPVFRFFPTVAAYSLILFVHLALPRDIGPGIFLYLIFLPCVIPTIIALLTLIFFIWNCISRKLQRQLQEA